MENKKQLPLRVGVGIILLNHKNNVFVGKRIDNPKNSWQMPQGGVNQNENFLHAARRELEEETGVKSVKLRISGRFNGAPRSKTRVFRINNIPLQTLNSNINYNQSIAYTNNGTFGIKLWISEK